MRSTRGLVNLMELSKRRHDSLAGFVIPRPPRRADRPIRSLNEQLSVLCPVRFGRYDLCMTYLQVFAECLELSYR